MVSLNDVHSYLLCSLYSLYGYGNLRNQSVLISSFLIFKNDIYLTSFNEDFTSIVVYIIDIFLDAFLEGSFAQGIPKRYERPFRHASDVLRGNSDNAFYDILAITFSLVAS